MCLSDIHSSATVGSQFAKWTGSQATVRIISALSANCLDRASLPDNVWREPTRATGANSGFGICLLGVEFEQMETDRSQRNVH